MHGRGPLICSAVSNNASFHEDFFFGSFDRVAVRATEAVLDLRAIRRES